VAHSIDAPDRRQGKYRSNSALTIKKGLDLTNPFKQTRKSGLAIS